MIAENGTKTKRSIKKRCSEWFGLRLFHPENGG